MATDYIIPTSIDLREIEQVLLPNLMADRRIFDIFTVRESDDAVVAWEQQDNFVGLQQLRGINGAPPKVTRVGGKRYIMQPGVYGEFAVVDENELIKRRAWAQFGQPINLADLVGGIQNQLLQRELDRIETIGWTLLTTGTFSISLPSGAIGHTDTYTTQTFTASVAWSTGATSTPLADFSNVQLLSRGFSVSFGADAKAYMNRKTARYMFSNTNSADLYGRRTAGLGTFNSPAQVNELLAGDDLPQIVIYDNGYLNDSGTFVPYIPDSKVVVIGNRTNGVPVAEYQKTRNASNDDLGPGSYTIVVDNAGKSVPRTVEVHRGHNGGPALLYPSAVVLMSV